MGNFSSSSSVLDLLNQMGLSDILSQSEVTDIYINQPYQLFVETLTGVDQVHLDGLDYAALYRLAKALCIYNALDFTNYSHAVSLPNGERGQIILPPAVEDSTIAFAIRKTSDQRLEADNWYATGRFDNVINVSNIEHWQKYNDDPSIKDEIFLKDWEHELIRLTNGSSQDILQALPIIVDHKLNSVMVGATGSGKTMFSRTLSDLISPQERIITLEDVHELELPKQPNKLHLLYKEGQITARELLFACMRLKPSRILITEIRSDIAWDYLTALNTGHPGGITSVHANSATDVFNRIATLAKESESARNLDFQFILNTVKATIDVIFFFEKTHLKQIYYNPYVKYLAKRGIW
ncbi:MAG: P-type DNA transfer ATPase VirB11 [Neisseriaceae bacterium]|nr:P-type DNA transfer ATPase VirB11 [Neisseriaceae bacterium]